MSHETKACDRNSGFCERFRQRTRLEQRDNLVVKLVTVHACDQIDKAAFRTAGVEAWNQMTNADRQVLVAAKEVFRVVA
jgi:hypothetical protein